MVKEKKCSECTIKKEHYNLLKEKTNLIEKNIRLKVEIDRLKKQVMSVLSHDENRNTTIFPEINSGAVINKANFDGIEYYKIQPTEKAFDVDIMHRKGGLKVPLTSMKFEIDTGPMSKKIEDKLKKKIESELKEKFKKEFETKEKQFKKEILKLKGEVEENELAIKIYKDRLKSHKKPKCGICHGTITTGGIECIKCKKEGHTTRCYICDEDVEEWKERGMPCLISPGKKLSSKDIREFRI